VKEKTSLIASSSDCDARRTSLPEWRGLENSGAPASEELRSYSITAMHSGSSPITLTRYLHIVYSQGAFFGAKHM
jgi:hypothetical protein